MSGPAVGVINIRWDDQTASYRVDRPNWNGGKVVVYEDVAELVAAAETIVDVLNRPSSARTRSEAWRRIRRALSNITGATK